MKTPTKMRGRGGMLHRATVEPTQGDRNGADPVTLVLTFTGLGGLLGAADGLVMFCVQIGAVAGVIALVLGTGIGAFCGAISSCVGLWLIPRKNLRVCLRVIAVVGACSAALASASLVYYHVTLFGAKYWLILLSPVPVCWCAIAILRTTLPDERTALHACSICGYNLTGNASGRCPECGTIFERGQLRADPNAPANGDDAKRLNAEGEIE